MNKYSLMLKFVNDYLVFFIFFFVDCHFIQENKIILS